MPLAHWPDSVREKSIQGGMVRYIPLSSGRTARIDLEHGRIDLSIGAWHADMPAYPVSGSSFPEYKLNGIEPPTEDERKEICMHLARAWEREAMWHSV